MPAAVVGSIKQKQCVYSLRLRNDLYCVEWGVKLYSLTRVYSMSCRFGVLSK